MINNSGGIRWKDGSPAYNEQVKKMGVPYSHISPEEGIKNQSLSNVLEQYKKRELNDWNDMSYADSIFKMIDDVIAYQLDKMTDMELDDFYRAHMQHFYEDKRNAVVFNDAWMEYRNRNE